MNEIAMKMPTAVSEGAALISVIERVARDPSVDIERLERLLAMKERMTEREAVQCMDSAMAECQSEMRPVAADSSNPQTRSKYASYAALDRALRPIYTKHGLALSFNTHPGAEPNFVRVICRVSHAVGASREYQIDMPADGKGARGNDVMTRTHATGSAISYGMRYLLKMIFNVSVGEYDDDGNSAGRYQRAAPPAPRTTPPPAPEQAQDHDSDGVVYDDYITQEQLDGLIAMCDEVGADKERFCRYLRIDGLAQLPAARYADAIKALEAKRGRK